MDALAGGASIHVQAIVGCALIAARLLSAKGGDDGK